MITGLVLFAVRNSKKTIVFKNHVVCRFYLSTSIQSLLLLLKYVRPRGEDKDCDAVDVVMQQIYLRSGKRISGYSTLISVT